MDYKVSIGWDEEAQAFVIVDSEIEGLWLEAPTRDALVAKIRDVAPELVGHNHGFRGAFSIKLLEPLTLSYAA